MTNMRYICTAFISSVWYLLTQDKIFRVVQFLYILWGIFPEIQSCYCCRHTWERYPQKKLFWKAFDSHPVHWNCLQVPAISSHHHLCRVFKDKKQKKKIGLHVDGICTVNVKMCNTTISTYLDTELSQVPILGGWWQVPMIFSHFLFPTAFFPFPESALPWPSCSLPQLSPPVKESLSKSCSGPWSPFQRLFSPSVLIFVSSTATTKHWRWHSASKNCITFILRV